MPAYYFQGTDQSNQIEEIAALLKKFPKFDIIYSAFYRKKRKYLDKKKKRMPKGIKVK